VYRNDKIILSFEIYHPKNNVHNQDGNHDDNKAPTVAAVEISDRKDLKTLYLYKFRNLISVNRIFIKDYQVSVSF
jgi:hypothetical protein